MGLHGRLDGTDGSDGSDDSDDSDDSKHAQHTLLLGMTWHRTAPHRIPSPRIASHHFPSLLIATLQRLGGAGWDGWSGCRDKRGAGNVLDLEPRGDGFAMPRTRRSMTDRQPSILRLELPGSPARAPDLPAKPG
ncbi:hypothetical protein E4U59_007202 [Claviceps monticola]|nr:hypothetical protein E4U59_007202 [Claviceps monticola]